MKLDSILLAVSGLQVIPSHCQMVLRQHIWSTVIYSRYGDHTPYILPTTSTLTPLGALKMYEAGNKFRDRYLGGSSSNDTTNILGISPSRLESDQISILALDDQFIVASALAFMQGLYPPLQASSDVSSSDGELQLANGSRVLSPLDGYQYPQLITASPSDLNSIWLMGANSCPSFQRSSIEYFESQTSQDLLDTTEDLYERLQSALPDIAPMNYSANYLNAYLIFDYLNYALVHNSSLLEDLPRGDLAEARTLADTWVSAIYGTTSTSSADGDDIQTISGRTLANGIVQALYSNINTSGSSAKMTLLFGGFEPIISFAALSGLASDQNSSFSGVPEYGSSMVFELFSLAENDTDSFPLPEDLKVRFFYRNGTDDDAELIAYPLFGNGPSGTSMALNEFVAEMREIMIPSPMEWCRSCASSSVFCVGAAEYEDGDEADFSRSTGGNRPSRVVSGVIGAFVTIAVIGSVIAGAMFFGGIRFHRQKTKNRTDLNGFKGGEKLASDPDLTAPKHVACTESGTSSPKGHERVGSWELGEQKKAEESQVPGLQPSAVPVRHPSFEDDDPHITPFADPVKPFDRV